MTIEITDLTTKIVTAYVSNNVLPVTGLPDLIRTVRESLIAAESGQTQAEPEKVELKPAVPIKKSVTDDYIICLEDGKRLKMLKRHLASAYGMTPDEYRAKWKLPSEYPMVAPAYAKARSKLALDLGLGRRSVK